MSYTVKLERFEGPLDLLLHLIQKAEVNIYDIPVAEITNQYIAYLYQMKEFNIEIASEFLLMAATLLEMKSKMLFPKQKEEREEAPFEKWEEELDPRDELIRRLIQYRAFREAADRLKEYALSRNHLYTRPAADLLLYAAGEGEEGAPRRLDVSILELYIAFQSVWNKKMEREKVATVEKEEGSVEKRSEELLFLLRQKGGILPFQTLFRDNALKGEIVLTFIALLELMKQGIVHCQQKNRFGEIEIIAKEAEGDGI